MTSLFRSIGASCSAALLVLALAACQSADEPDPTDPTSAGSTTTETPTEGAQETPQETPSDPASPATPDDTGRAVAVYYAGDGPDGKARLYRAFQRVEGDPLVEAARLVMEVGEPADPDYRTLWPQVEVSAVTATDGVLLVEIPGDGFTERPDGMSRRDARLALQQVVYTLQGVLQERAPVQFQRTDAPARLFGIDVSSPVTHANALRVLNHINITSPSEGDVVSGDTVTVTGVANSFEASGPCRLIAGDEEVALVAYQAEGWMGNRLFPFEVELPLADAGTGDVVVQCETDDPSGGAEGPGSYVDAKLITVE